MHFTVALYANESIFFYITETEQKAQHHTSNKGYLTELELPKPNNQDSFIKNQQQMSATSSTRRELSDMRLDTTETGEKDA